MSGLLFCIQVEFVSVLQVALLLRPSVRFDPEMNDLWGSQGSNMAWRSCSVLFRLTGEDVLRSSGKGGRSVRTAVEMQPAPADGQEPSAARSVAY